MKIIAISDVHLDARTAGVARYEEAMTALYTAASFAVDNKADLFLFNGDLCNADCGSFAWVCATASLVVAKKLLKNNIQQVWVAGNHDVEENGTNYTTLSPISALLAGNIYGCVFESPGIRVLSSKNHSDRVTLRGPETLLIALPFTSSDERSTNRYDPYETYPKLYQDALKWEACSQIVVASHLTTIAGSVELGDESQELARGRGVPLPVEQIAKNKIPTLVLQGHFHRKQEVVPKVEGGWPHAPIQIIGAPVRFNFGEASHAPSFLEINL